MQKRWPVDLSHFAFSCGDIGKLQTLACVPVVGGDSLQMGIEGVFRLSPLRRNLVVDCNVEIFTFFQPHRHIYEADWITFIKDGMSESVTFADLPTVLEGNYLGCHYAALEDVPLWVVDGYNNIFNRYFRSPSDVDERTTFPTGARENLFGLRCGHLPVPWSTSVLDGVATSERAVSTVGDTFDLADLNTIKASYRTEVDRQYFGKRYSDIMKTGFGAGVNTDADQRPTLLMRNQAWLSGYDVDGTDDASLGQYSGKSAAVVRGGIRRKFFAEHGALWIMALLRFPTIHVDERPFLNTTPNPSYLEFTGDAQVVGAEPPTACLLSDFFEGAAATDIGENPFGQHYRYHPSLVHKNYKDLDGYSFLDIPVDNRDKANYITSGEYNDVFQTDQLGQWQVASRIDIVANRVVPPSRGSLYAGG